jgi:hypothetical protein
MTRLPPCFLRKTTKTNDSPNARRSKNNKAIQKTGNQPYQRVKKERNELYISSNDSAQKRNAW